MSSTVEQISSNTRVAVTLVHGTWAPGAPWTQPDSPFSKQLCEELQAHGATSVTISRFDWSGGNSHFDRRLASLRLRKHLADLLRTQPDACHFVVAHSHGGNVALRAVGSSPTLCRRISGLIAIATPFLTFRQESFRLALLRPALQSAVKAIKEVLLWFVSARLMLFAAIFETPVILVPVAVMTFLAWLFYKHVMPHIIHWLTYSSTGSMLATGYQVLALLVAVGLAVFALAWGWDEATQAHLKKLQRESRRVFLRYSYSQPEARLADTPVLVLSSLLDEAYGVLAGSWWMHRATGWGVRSGISAALLTTVIIAGAVGFELEQQMFAAMPRLGWATLLKTLSPIVLGLSMMLAIWLAATLVGLFLAISGRSSLGLGLADPDDNLVCEVRARRGLSLPIQTTKKRYATWQLLRHAKGALFHSRIYYHPPAISDIAAWISSPRDRAEGAQHREQNGIKAQPAMNPRGCEIGTMSTVSRGSFDARPNDPPEKAAGDSPGLPA